MFPVYTYKMDTDFDKVIADLRNLREDVREVKQDYDLELEMCRSDLRQQFGFKILMILSFFLNGLFIAYHVKYAFVSDEPTTINPRLL